MTRGHVIDLTTRRVAPRVRPAAVPAHQLPRAPVSQVVRTDGEPAAQRLRRRGQHLVLAAAWVALWPRARVRRVPQGHRAAHRRRAVRGAIERGPVRQPVERQRLGEVKARHGRERGQPICPVHQATVHAPQPNACARHHRRRADAACEAQTAPTLMHLHSTKGVHAGA